MFGFCGGFLGWFLGFTKKKDRLQFPTAGFYAAWAGDSKSEGPTFCSQKSEIFGTQKCFAFLREPA